MKKWFWHCGDCQRCGIVGRNKNEGLASVVLKISKVHDQAKCESRKIDAKSLANLKKTEFRAVIGTLKKYSFVAASS